MARLDWDGTMCVGVDHLDDEHRRIAILINLIHDALLFHDSATAASLMPELERRVGQHFDRERRIFGRHGGPEHRAECDEAEHSLHQLGSRLADPDAALPVLDAFATAILACIRRDGELVQRLRSKGLGETK